MTRNKAMKKIEFFYGGTETFQREVIGRLRETMEVGNNERTKFRYI